MYKAQVRAHGTVRRVRHVLTGPRGLQLGDEMKGKVRTDADGDVKLETVHQAAFTRELPAQSY